MPKHGNFNTALVVNIIATFMSPYAAAPLESPFIQSSGTVSGQIRTRTEYDSKDVRDTAVNKALLSTHLRTRIGFTTSPSEKVEIKVELQDSRIFGSEIPPSPSNPATATTSNTKGVDLLQGYVLIKEGDFGLALGRQKMSLGAGRFLSTLEWSPTSRSFDGASFNWNMNLGDLTALVFLVRDSSSITTQDRMLLTGAHYSYPVASAITSEVYGFYEQSRLPTTYAGLTTQNSDLYYLGERVAGRVGIFLFEEEFIWQGGELTGATSLTSAAFQLAIRLGIALKSTKVIAGLDVMSGDDNLLDKNVNNYRANYYFAHALYGWMDYFASNPMYGVIDYRLEADVPLLINEKGNARVTLKPQYHFYTPQHAPAVSDDPYGQEFDFEAHLALYPKSNIVLGAGIFLPGKSASQLPAAKITNSNFSEQPGWFLYCMPVFNF